MNGLKTTVLLVALAVFFVWAGRLIGGRQGMTIALVFALAMNAFAYWFSDKMVLRMYRAQEVDEATAPELYGIVRRLSSKAGLPMPRVYIIPQDQPNAFATGRNPKHAAVAATEGILRLLTPEELAGVIGHELSHVKHRDILISSVAATVAAAISYLAQMGQWALIFGGGGRGRDRDENPLAAILMMFIAPIIAIIIQMAISRSREYSADESGAELAGNPRFLSNALRKLDFASKRVPMRATPATAHMFIVNPLSGKFLLKLFSTHPPIEERIRRLEGGQ
ncbi:MAG: zinc metalloprotease HtpX [Nitrospiraceae bacterium]|nr:zinc metalloprotease HtpX [Nitrospiraceae bacterium]